MYKQLYLKYIYKNENHKNIILQNGGVIRLYGYGETKDELEGLFSDEINEKINKLKVNEKIENVMIDFDLYNITKDDKNNLTISNVIPADIKKYEIIIINNFLHKDDSLHMPSFVGELKRPNRPNRSNRSNEV